jgi:hypothetical protein
MKLLTVLLVSLGIATSLATATTQAAGKQWGKFSGNVIDSESSQSVDYNEELHLVYMRGEEKLARDVYTTFSMLYPRARVFGNIDDAEQTHMDAVRDKLAQYDITDPNTIDNIGVFTGKEFGKSFREAYLLLVKRGERSKLDALYVGAYVEELDIRDIDLCPDEIISQNNGVYSADDCGRAYTDNPDIKRLLNALLKGSESHLRAYVRNIERYIGAGSYEAQVLTQAEVDAILRR